MGRPIVLWVKRLAQTQPECPRMVIEYGSMLLPGFRSRCVRHHSWVRQLGRGSVPIRERWVCQNSGEALLQRVEILLWYEARDTRGSGCRPGWLQFLANTRKPAGGRAFSFGGGLVEAEAPSTKIVHGNS